MKQKNFLKILAITLFSSFFSYSQTISDDFEDGNLTGWTEGTSGDWTNSTSSPITGTRSLKHNLSSVSGESYIYHDISALDLTNEDTSWQFNLANGAWDPSGSNRFWVYLTANETDLSSSTVDGYAVGVNLTGTSDILTLWKVTNGAADGAIVTSSLDWGSGDTVGIKVTRSSTGTWELSIDSDGGFDSLVSSGSAVNTDYTHDGSFGLFFEFTSTRAGLLRMDDITVQGAAPSSDPSVTFDTATSAENETDSDVVTSGIPITLSNYDADVTITATINGSSTAEAGDYTLDVTPLTFDANETLVLPLTIKDDADSDDETIVINFTVTSGTADLGISTHTVTITDNELPNLVINEFMADPDSTNGDANGDGTLDTGDDEFIEIYNASGSELNIGGYTIEDSSGLRHTFPKGTILPAAGTIVVFGGGTPTNIPSLTQVSSVGFLGLNNTGDTITIKDAGGTVVTSYSYSSEGNNNISLARNPDLTGGFVTHDNVTGNGGVLFSPGRDNTDNTGFYNTWSGTTNNVWSTTTNWIDSDNPSAASDNIYIPSGLTNYPTASSTVTVNATFIGSGASLIAESTYAGTIYYQRNLGTTNWYLVSSPVGGEIMTDMRANNDFASGTAPNIGFAPYDNSQASSNDRWDYFANTATTALVDGKGYSTKLASAGNITFSGSMNVSNFTSINLSDNSGGSGNAFNLLGNPYPSFISISSLLSANDSGGNNLLTESTIWIWNKGTSTYDQRNSATIGANAFIAPGQGFFVNADGTSTTFNITEAMQSHGSGESFQKNSRTEIKLFLSDESKIRKSEIYYINGTTTNFDNGFDSSIFGGITNDFQVYTKHVTNNNVNEQKLGIQSLPNSNYENMVIPIGVIADANKEITFSTEVTNLPEGLNVYLEDRIANTFTQLDEVNAEYKITLTEKLDGIGRFYLHTKSSALNLKEVDLNSIRIYQTSNSNLMIAGLPQGKSTFKLFNLLGKEILNNSFSSSGNKEIFLPNLASGIYIVQLETESGKLNKKITLE